MSLEPDASYDLDLAAATLQSNATDVGILLTVLVNQLSEVLGNRLVVTRSGGRFKKSNEIKSVQATLANDVLEATVDGGSLRCTVGHSSGGIRIRSEQVGMDEWIKRLLGAVQAEATHSQVARQALENIVIGERP